MTVSLTGTGGLFTRLGKIAAVLQAVNLFRGVGLYRVSSLVIATNTATVTTQTAHGYTTGDTVKISGVTGPGNATNANSSFTITVTSTTAFTFAVTASNNTATGTIIAEKTAGVGFFGVGPYFDNIEAQYQSADQNLVDGLYSARDTYRSTGNNLATYLRSLAQSTVIQQVNDDTPLSQQTLSAALAVLIAQMTTAVASVKKPTVSTAVTAGTNTGTGTLEATTTGPTGVQLDYPIPETITFTCTRDAFNGGTAGQETFSITSPVAETNLLQWDYPLGSGLNTSISAVDATLSNAGGNKLVNSSWETFTVANTPDKWPILTGAAGVQVFSEASIVYKGAKSLKFLGDGSNLTAVYQPFNSTSLGTSYNLLPSTVYAWNFWIRVSATPAAGVLRIALTDGSNSVVNDSATTANSSTSNLTGVSTSWVNLQGFFRTPAVTPATGYRFQLGLTTALDNAKSLYMDNLSLTPATRLYSGGPYVGLFSGATNFLVGDSFTLAVTNKLDSQWQFYANRLFNLTGLGLQLPSSGSPTVADSLIA